MFSRVVLRRIDPAAGAGGRADDIESQPLSPRSPEHEDEDETEPEPEMAERSGTRASRLMRPRQTSFASRFRFSSSTATTSAASSEWPTPQTAQMSRAQTDPYVPRPGSNHDPEDEDDEVLGAPMRRESTLPSRYSVVVDLPSTRLYLPGLQRTWTMGSNGPPTSRPVLEPEPEPEPEPEARTLRRIPEPLSPACRPHTPPERTTTGVTEPQLALQPRRSTNRLGSDEADELYPAGDRRSRGFFTATDPAERQLAEMAADGRARRQRSGRGRSGRHRSRREGETDEVREVRRERRMERRRRRDSEEGEEGSERTLPKHFLFCFPWIKSRKIRSQILQCFVSGTFLVLLLGTYLALSLTRNISNSEFSVLLILIILFSAIFFFQVLIRLCLQIMRPKPVEEERPARSARMYGPGGYAIPRQPIRVVLARDEEAAGIESETTKMNPPAYGLWRESVRVDPNRIYWQRNTESASPTIEEEDEDEAEGSDSSSGEEGPSSRPRKGPRPPSYVSEDGVSYVVEARPRSVAPVANVQMVPMPMPMPMPMPITSPLPAHPSERGRVGTPPSR